MSLIHRMKDFLNRLRSRQVVFVHDLAMVPIAWLAAYWLRFNLDTVPPAFLDKAVLALALVVPLQGAVFWFFGLYRGVWRYASVQDLIRIVKAVTASVGLAAAGIFLTMRLTDVPRSVFVLDWILLVFLLGGPRFVYRWFKDHRFEGGDAKRLLIVGAGQAGEMLVRDLMRGRERAYVPVAFVDDDPVRIGKEIHGTRVVGGFHRIPAVVAERAVDLIVIAIDEATSKQMQRIVDLCEKSAAPFRILPSLKNVVDGKVSVNELRDVRIEDLLGREAVSLDWAAISAAVKGETVLVTGGGGSIGAELCRQIARLGPARLVVFERNEFNLYNIELELRQAYPGLALTAMLGDVCDPIGVEQALIACKPSIVFHAAAYKHVPMLEGQVRAGARNNVLGTQTVASLAHAHGVATFVLISTDKAVNPANVMGMTKRVAEIYCQALSNESSTRFITVRFGNVLGSAGSVVPLFQKQIAAGGPVTVTHPDISRYFMTIPEACQLILQASVLGRGGEIFVLDMGEPVKIAYLAEQLILLSGKKPGEDIEIVYTGLRPGEKLYEELFHDKELLLPTVHAKILLASSREVMRCEVEPIFERIERACRQNNEDELNVLLVRLVPEGAAGRDAAAKAASG